MELFHDGIDEAPADGGVEDLRRALKRRLGLAHDERSARHRFGAAGDGEIDLARLDRPRRRGERVHSRSAQAVDRHARNGVGKSGEQEGHAREVAVVLARLVGAAQDDLLHFVRKAGMTAHQLSDRQRRKIIRAHARERPGVPADRGADIIADIGFGGHRLRSCRIDGPSAGAGRLNIRIEIRSAIVASLDPRLVISLNQSIAIHFSHMPLPCCLIRKRGLGSWELAGDRMGNWRGGFGGVARDSTLAN